jgi:aminopeptidase N
MNLAGATYGEREQQRDFYIGTADLDPMAKSAFGYVNSFSYAGVTYGKTASVLLTLEGIIGEDTMAKAMHTYFMKYRFTHPAKEDFLKTIEEVSGKDLRWYFNQAVYGTQVLDYEVLSANSYPTNWFEEKKDDQKKERNARNSNTVYQSYVTVHRKGEFVMPIEVEVKFDNDENIREHWDGQSRWTRFSYVKKAKVASAEIDPDHTIYIDHDNFNDSLVLDPNPKATHKLSTLWLFVTQWMSQAMAWWAV